MVAAKVTNADARVESGGVIVLDRVGLDGLIEQVAPDQTPMKVLLVRGTPRSGKSWSRHRFERAATAWGAKSVYICDGMVGSVQDMVYLLFSEVGASDRIPPMDTSPTAWYRTVCYRLREEASRLNRPLWIAVDDLGVAGDGTPLLDPEIRRFFDQLALLLLNPSFREMFRLMLIHYPDGAVPTKWPTDLWCEDRTCDTDIDKAHVAVMIRSWSDARGRTVLDDEVAELADGVITTAEADLEPGTPPTPRLRRIYDALTSLLRQLDGVLP
jgi:hypothetical protein